MAYINFSAKGDFTVSLVIFSVCSPICSLCNYIKVNASKIYLYINVSIILLTCGHHSSDIKYGYVNLVCDM